MEKTLEYYGVIDEINLVQIEQQLYYYVVLDCVNAYQIESLYFNQQNNVKLLSIIDNLELESILIRIPQDQKELFPFNNLSEGKLVKVYESSEDVKIKSERLSFYTTDQYQGENYTFEILNGRLKPYRRLLNDLNLEKSAKEYINYEKADELLNSLILSVENERFVSCYNVGQGNAVCISEVDKENQSKPLLYFDIGGGANFNRFTYPDTNTRNFKVEENTLFILSHWDEDHYETANRDPNLIQNKTYIAPAQRVNFRNLTFINHIIRNGNLILIPSGFTPITFSLGKLLKCTGSNFKKNDSGLVLALDLKKENNISTILLPGDAQYKCIPDIEIEKFDALMATHHGGKLYRPIRVPTTTNEKGYIAYSYGEINYTKNIYKHPLSASVVLHENSDWGTSITALKKTRLDTKDGDILFSYIRKDSISCAEKKENDLTNQFIDTCLNVEFKIGQIFNE